MENIEKLSLVLVDSLHLKERRGLVREGREGGGENR